MSINIFLHSARLRCDQLRPRRHHDAAHAVHRSSDIDSPRYLHLYLLLQQVSLFFMQAKFPLKIYITDFVKINIPSYIYAYVFFRLVVVSEDGRMRLRCCGKFVSGIGRVRTNFKKEQLDTNKAE